MLGITDLEVILLYSLIHTFATGSLPVRQKVARLQTKDRYAFCRRQIKDRYAFCMLQTKDRYAFCWLQTKDRYAFCYFFNSIVAVLENCCKLLFLYTNVLPLFQIIYNRK